jgi:hypothetical protein
MIKAGREKVKCILFFPGQKETIYNINFCDAKKEVWLVSVMSACHFLLVLVCDCHSDKRARWRAVHI